MERERIISEEKVNSRAYMRIDPSIGSRGTTLNTLDVGGGRVGEMAITSNRYSIQDAPSGYRMSDRKTEFAEKKY